MKILILRENFSFFEYQHNFKITQAAALAQSVRVFTLHAEGWMFESQPSGKPCIFYCLPELEGTKDYSTQVDPDILGICRNRCLFNQNNPGDTDMLHLFKLLMEENELSSPGNVDEATTYFFQSR